MNVDLKQHQVGNLLATQVSAKLTAGDFANYTVIKNSIFNLGLSPNAILIYSIIDSFNSNGKPFWGSNEYLAETLHIKERAVQYILKELENKGLIKRIYTDDKSRSGREEIIALPISLPATESSGGMQNFAQGYAKNCIGVRKKLHHTNQVTKQVYKSADFKKKKPRASNNESAVWQMRAAHWQTKLKVSDDESKAFFALFKKYQHDLGPLEYQCGNISDAAKVRSKTAMLTNLAKKVYKA